MTSPFSCPLSKLECMATYARIPQRMISSLPSVTLLKAPTNRPNRKPPAQGSRSACTDGFFGGAWYLHWLLSFIAEPVVQKQSIQDTSWQTGTSSYFHNQVRLTKGKFRLLPEVGATA